MKEKNKFLEAALFYAQRVKRAILPLNERAKEPNGKLVPHGWKQATTDPHLIRQWWKAFPNGNIGFRLDPDDWCLDIDPSKGGEESRARLVQEHGALRATLQQSTGSLPVHGSHRVYHQPAKGPKVRLVKGWMEGIDLVTGYIVAHPSIHPTGGEYVWDTAKRSILEEPISEPDEWLIELIRAGSNGAPLHEALKRPEKFPKGRQQAILVSFAGLMRGWGCTGEEIEACLQVMNRNRCTQPGKPERIHQYAFSMENYAPQHRLEELGELGEREPAKQASGKREIILPEPQSVDELLDADIALPEALIEGLLPKRGLALMVGAQRAGKTILAAQTAIALATNKPLLDRYALNAHGRVIVIEKDDPGGEGSFKALYVRAQVPRGTPIDFYGPERIPAGFEIGPVMLEWLEKIVVEARAVLVVMDSFTALRPQRKSSNDISKQEWMEIYQMDQLAKRLGFCVLLLHHESVTTRANASLEWDARGAGTFGMSAASEAQVFIQRYRDLAIDAPERHVRFRTRHTKEHQATLAYRVSSGLFEHVVDGPAALHYTVIQEIQRAIRATDFSAKDLEEPLGISRPTAFRYCAQLVSGGILWRNPKGSTYRFAPDIERLKAHGFETDETVRQMRF